MADVTSAQAMVGYYSERPPQIRGRTVYVQFSNHEQLKTESSAQVCVCVCVCVCVYVCKYVNLVMSCVLPCLCHTFPFLSQQSSVPFHHVSQFSVWSCHRIHELPLTVLWKQLFVIAQYLVWCKCYANQPFSNWQCSSELNIVFLLIKMWVFCNWQCRSEPNTVLLLIKMCGLQRKAIVLQ